MITIDEIALWYLIAGGLYIGGRAVMGKGDMNRMRVSGIIAGVAALIVLFYMFRGDSEEEGFSSGWKYDPKMWPGHGNEGEYLKTFGTNVPRMPGTIPLEHDMDDE